MSAPVGNDDDDGLAALCEALDCGDQQLDENQDAIHPGTKGIMPCCTPDDDAATFQASGAEEKHLDVEENTAKAGARLKGPAGSDKRVTALGNLVYSQQVAGRMQGTKKNKKDFRSVEDTRRVFQDVGQGALVSKYSGLRVSKPLISSAQLQSSFESLSFIRIDQMRQRVIQDTVPKRWCTIGVVGEVSVPRTAQKGGQYCIWKLTDLKETMIMLYVFGNAFLDFRNEVKPGSLVCVVGGRTRRSVDAVTLSIDSYAQLMICGDSTDFAYCSGKRKDGQPCRIPVNKSTCEYCSYHVGAAYKQISSLRKELQGGSLGSAFQKGRTHLKWTVGSFERKEAHGTGNRSAKKESLKNAAEKSLGKSGSMGSKYLVTCADPAKALHLVKEEDARKKRMAAERRIFTKAPIPSKHLAAVVVDYPRTRGKNTGKCSLQQGKKSSNSDVFVQLDDDHDAVSAYAMDLTSGLPDARTQAIAILKKKKPDSQKAAVDAPSFLAKSLEVHSTKSERNSIAPVQEKIDAVSSKKRVINSERAVRVEHKPTSTPIVSTPSAFEALFGDVIKEMQTNTRGNPVQSRYKHIVEAADDQALMDTLDVLEKKDNMAQKMDSVKALKVTAFRCAFCSVITEKRHDICLIKHPESLSRIDTVKRWWKCSDCKKVFSTLGVNYPTDACIKCNSNQATFEKHSMYQPMSKTKEGMVTAGVACKENMLPRGREQKWVNE